MADLFDPTMSPAAALAILRDVATRSDPLIGQAVEALAADHETLQAIAASSAGVRAAQRLYFRDRSNLEDCKQLERRLDKQLAERAAHA